MGNIYDFLVEDHRGEVDLAMCRISELDDHLIKRLEEIADLEATIKNKDHIIDALKKKIKRLKQRESGRLNKGSK